PVSAAPLSGCASGSPPNVATPESELHAATETQKRAEPAIATAIAPAAKIFPEPIPPKRRGPFDVPSRVGVSSKQWQRDEPASPADASVQVAHVAASRRCVPSETKE